MFSCPLCLAFSFLSFVPLEKHFKHTYYLLCLSSLKAVGGKIASCVSLAYPLLTRCFCLQCELKDCLLIHAQDKKLSHVGHGLVCVCVFIRRLYYLENLQSSLCSDINCMPPEGRREDGTGGCANNK